MREYPAWKSRLLPGTVAALALAGLWTARVDAQEPTKLPTPAQLDLVGKIMGVGPIKFGMAVDDFAKDDLVPINSSGATSQFQYADAAKLTWGGLHPTRVEVRFYYDHLVAIRLYFSGTYGDLLAVDWALRQKYGTTNENSPYAINDSNAANGNFGTKLWRSTGDMVEMCAAFPEEIFDGSDDAALAQKVEGAVDLFDADLGRKLSRDHHDALNDEVLRGHDLEKIKSDL